MSARLNTNFTQLPPPPQPLFPSVSPPLLHLGSEDSIESFFIRDVAYNLSLCYIYMYISCLWFRFISVPHLFGVICLPLCWAVTDTWDDRTSWLPVRGTTWSNLLIQEKKKQMMTLTEITVVLNFTISLL